MLKRVFPFLGWWPLNPANLRADAVAGITVALVLVPQSMAYAQLAGLPAYYGLYASFLPVIVAALWGSSHQLATGPVAVVSLLTASALAPLASAGSAQFIAMAVTLALLVGVIQLILGVSRLGTIVSFLSHPVISGFTNAAAIIIALSQLSKLLGVSMGRSDSFFRDIWGVLQQLDHLHWPTLAMGLAAFALMWGLKKIRPKAPGVLIAVVLSTLVSWAIGFERNAVATIDDLGDAGIRAVVAEHHANAERLDALGVELATTSQRLREAEKQSADEYYGGARPIAAARYHIELLRVEIADLTDANRRLARRLRGLSLVRTEVDGRWRYYLYGRLPPDAVSDGHRWRLGRVKRDGALAMVGGGEVVGEIPAGLPSVGLPDFGMSTLGTLLSAALVIALVGFMEAISIAKAMAAKTRQRLDPNQELIGQGLGNIVGSLTFSFPVSGSFSRSAVALDAGARSGLYSVFTGLVVMLTLLFLTPLLYHLPQAVLAAIIMMAVVGLVNFRAIQHAWLASRHDGAAALVTFGATLVFAPHLDQGILLGAGLAIVLFLYRTMRPRVAILVRHGDGTLRDAQVFPDLPRCESVIALRYDGRLYFANVPFFEDAVLAAVAAQPQAKYLLIVGDAINEIDASGEEVVYHLVRRLKDVGVTVGFSGLKKQVLDVLRATHLMDHIGEDNIFSDEERAFAHLALMLGDDAVKDLLRPRNPAVGVLQGSAT